MRKAPKMKRPPGGLQEPTMSPARMTVQQFMHRVRRRGAFVFAVLAASIGLDDRKVDCRNVATIRKGRRHD